MSNLNYNYDGEDSAADFLSEIANKKGQKIHPELQNFLDQVEEVSDIVRGIASSNPEEQARALRRADVVLQDDCNKEKLIGDPDKVECKVKSNRTVINRSRKPKEDGDMDKDAWMKMMERDAEERTENRRQRKEKSDEFRTKGNDCFANENYDKALYYYNQALILIKDSPCLYNNRALTFIRLGIYSEGLKDCERALEIDEKNLRAHLFKAKILFLLGKHEECNQCVQEAKEKLPNRLSAIEDYSREHFIAEDAS